jgi:hypothetical protein
MQSKTDFHERFCLKKHKRLAWVVFAVWTLLTALNTHLFLTHPDTEFGGRLSRYSTMFSALILVLFVAPGLSREAKCTSERVILCCLIGGIMFRLMWGLGLMSTHRVRELTLPLHFVILFSIAADLKAAYRQE